MKRIFAEWEEQDFILLSFPHEEMDWNAYLQEVREVFYQIIIEILKRQKCLLLCKDKKQTKALIENYFITHQINLNLLHNLLLFKISCNDTWVRDFGGISIKSNKHIEVLNYSFNGWGLKYPAFLDNQVTAKLHKKGIFKKLKTKNFVLEGGSIESNGEGILLTTAQCLLEKNRNQGYSKAQIQNQLKKDLGIKKILWLHHGYLSGDDTNSHIDTLARFIAPNTIAYIQCQDKTDEHYQSLQQMEQELQSLTNLKGKKFKLIALPFCSPKYYENKRLPATYANFLFINGAILLPIYQDQNDQKAISILKQACPKHQIIPIDCSILIREHGSLHCLSMQFPKGTL